MCQDYIARTSFLMTFERTSKAPRYVPCGEHCIRVFTVSNLLNQTQSSLRQVLL